MRHGKQVCKILKEIRQQIAERNDIELFISECHFQGECKGTCPKCEAEVRYLEKELNQRRQLGKAVAVTGISLGMAGTFATYGTPTEKNMQSPEREVSVDIIVTPDTLVNTRFPSLMQDSVYKRNLFGDFDLDDMVIKNELFEERLNRGNINEVYNFVGGIGAMAEYPGGEEKLHKFLKDNLVYPKEAGENRIQGTVLIEFTIGKDGSVSDAKVLRDIGFGCGEEAVRVVKMTKWKPGKIGGENVESTYTLPIKFQLQKNESRKKSL